MFTMLHCAASMYCFNAQLHCPVSMHCFTALLHCTASLPCFNALLQMPCFTALLQCTASMHCFKCSADFRLPMYSIPVLRLQLFTSESISYSSFHAHEKSCSLPVCSQQAVVYRSAANKLLLTGLQHVSYN